MKHPLLVKKEMRCLAQIIGWFAKLFLWIGAILLVAHLLGWSLLFLCKVIGWIVLACIVLIIVAAVGG